MVTSQPPRLIGGFAIQHTKLPIPLSLVLKDGWWLGCPNYHNRQRPQGSTKASAGAYRYLDLGLDHAQHMPLEYLYVGNTAGTTAVLARTCPRSAGALAFPVPEHTSRAI